MRPHITGRLASRRAVLLGDFAKCLNPVKSGITTDGGYAEVMIAAARALAAIPDELTPVEAAPLLCAGITTYNALRNAGLRAGDLVGIPTPRYATSS